MDVKSGGNQRYGRQACGHICKKCRKPKEPKSLSPEQRTRIARLGGKAAASIPGHMSAIGKKGGLSVSNNRAWMAEIGARGGSKRKKSEPIPANPMVIIRAKGHVK